MGGDFYQLIWLPDTFFLNGKTFQTHKSTASTGSNTLIELDYNGSILYSTRMTVVASCPMDLSYFPADRQRCQLNFGSCKFRLFISKIHLQIANFFVSIHSFHQ